MSSAHLAPYIVIIILLTAFLMLYFTSLWLFCNYQFILLNLLTFFTQSTKLPFIWQPSIYSLYLWICFYFVFKIPHSKIIWYLSFSDLFHQAQFPLGPSICHRWQHITPSDMKHLFLIHSSTDGHFCRCHILPVVSIAVRNTGVHADITILDPPKTEVPIWWTRQGSSSTFFSHTISMSCFG